MYIDLLLNRYYYFQLWKWVEIKHERTEHYLLNFNFNNVSNNIFCYTIYLSTIYIVFLNFIPTLLVYRKIVFYINNSVAY